MSTTTSGVEGVELEAGRELDALVAERVMGEVCGHAPVDDGCSRTSQYWAPTLAEVDAIIREKFAAHKLWPAQYCGPEYSTDIAAAWLVVERLAEMDLWVDLCDMRHGCYRHKDDTPWRGWRAEICDIDREDEHGPIPVSHEYSDHPWSAEADTAPLAICRAAIRATSPQPTSRTTNPEASTGEGE